MKDYFCPVTAKCSNARLILLLAELNDRNDRIIDQVELVVLADESNQAYISTPLKRWHDIGVQPRLIITVRVNH